MFAAVRAVEADSTVTRATGPKAILLAATPLGARGGAVMLADRTTRFGPALPLEPIDSAGRINGDVVYVANLGDRNDVLRVRFKDRTWHRLAIRSMADGSLRAEVVP